MTSDIELSIVTILRWRPGGATSKSRKQVRLIHSLGVYPWVVLLALSVSQVSLAQKSSLPSKTTTTQAANNEIVSPVQQAHTDSIWFDAENGAVLPVDLPPTSVESSNRDSRWLPKAQRVKTPTPTGGGGGGGMNLSLGNAFGWALLTLLLVTAIAALVFGLSKVDWDDSSASRKRSDARYDDTPDEVMIERMKHLPQELRRTDVNLRSEAERLMREGLFDHAIILLFGHQLLLLDRERFLRLNRGKTNRRYVRECRSRDTVAAEQLQQTVEAFERSYFGKHAIQTNEFDSLWQNNLKLETLLRESSEVAA